ncbi:MAG: MBOAT family protein [Rhodobacteraceae bacterium]|nr:MBOAT family protein [Paracoccaceae bacterium]
MLFPTVEFILFFCVVMSFVWVLRPGVYSRNLILLAASYVFYGAWDLRFLALMGGVSLIAYGAGRMVGPTARYGAGIKKIVLVVSIAALLGTLGIFKYFNFFALSLQQLLEAANLSRDWQWLEILLPVGLSFYVFQAISYIVDVLRGDVDARRDPVDVFLYISFFPQLVAGPIVRASVFLPQIGQITVPDANMRARAVVLISTGLLKKMVIANYLSVLLVDPVFLLPEGQNALTAGIGLLGYAVQIYCDFSGYSDIAIGVALLLGFHFPANFRQPYRADSLRDFWQRWHISLSSWIRDYLYVPLGGSYGSTRRTAGILLLTMTLAGLWHGAGWNFILWGCLHGAALVAERVMRGIGVKPPQLIRIALVLGVVLLLWIPFRASSIGVTVEYLAAFGRWESYAPTALTPTVFALLVAGMALNWLPVSFGEKLGQGMATLPATLQAIVLSLICFALFAAAQEGVAPFIYFQF